MKNFHQVNDKIFRGSAPTIFEVKVLQEIWGVKTIISLDLDTALNIKDTCESLKIKHIILPIEFDKKTPKIIDFLSSNIIKLLEKNSPTFIHCYHGKDRTGLAVALYRIKNDGWSKQEALEEAHHFGFGIGMDPDYTKLFVKTINQAAEDRNDADIVSNMREPNPAVPFENSSLFDSNVPIFDSEMGELKYSPERDVHLADDSMAGVRRRIKMRKKYFEDLNDAIPQVGLIDNINPLLRGISPYGAGPLGVLPYGNYYL